MSTTPATVTSELDLTLVLPGQPPLPVAATARYLPSDPFAVHLGFRTGGADVVEWTFARQLLTDGVTRSSGDGDVQVWPSHGEDGQVVCLALSSPSGRALFEVPVAALVAFLSDTYEAVPTGTESEHVDMDAELALLLWSDGPSAV